MSNSTVTCAHCSSPAAPDKPWKICSKCKEASYCSVDCQHRHWRTHRVSCNESSKPFRHAEDELVPFCTTFGLPNPRHMLVLPKEEALPHGFESLVLTSIPPSTAPNETTECALPLGMKELIVAQPDFPRPIPSPTSSAHQIAPVPGVGLGMFATRYITAGELVFAERALIIEPVAMPALNVSGLQRADFEKAQLKNREAFLGRLLGRMWHEKATEFRRLASSRAREGPYVLCGISDTNAWSIIEPEMRAAIPGFSPDSIFRIVGVCAMLSRINHSCSPNAVISFDISSFSFAVRVIRDVPAGSQITVSYIDLTSRSVETRQEILSRWRFTCTCVSCSSPRASDTRRKEIAASDFDWQEVLMTLMDTSQRVDLLIERSLRILRLITEEGLQSITLYRDHLAVLGLAYASLGDRERHLWASARISEVNFSKAETEALSADEKLLWTFYPNPEKYAFWNLRRRINARKQGK